MAIYTRKGDGGDTGLADGTRVPKSHPRVEAYGDVDELNAWLGWALAHARGEHARAVLPVVQRDLFALGAQLANAKPKEKSEIPPERLAEFERRMDEIESACGPLRSFILPGGTPAAAALHVARAVCRRAERRVVDLARLEPVPAQAVAYLNRLGDLLFMLARDENRAAGVADTAW